MAWCQECNMFERSIHILVSSPNYWCWISPWFLLQSMFSELNPPLFDWWRSASFVFLFSQFSHCFFPLLWFPLKALFCKICGPTTYNPRIVSRDNLQCVPKHGFCLIFCHPLKLSLGCIPVSKWVRSLIQTTNLTGDLPCTTGLCLLSTYYPLSGTHIRNQWFHGWIMLNPHFPPMFCWSNPIVSGLKSSTKAVFINIAVHSSWKLIS